MYIYCEFLKKSNPQYFFFMSENELQYLFDISLEILKKNCMCVWHM